MRNPDPCLYVLLKIASWDNKNAQILVVPLFLNYKKAILFLYSLNNPRNLSFFLQKIFKIWLIFNWFSWSFQKYSPTSGGLRPTWPPASRSPLVLTINSHPIGGFVWHASGGRPVISFLRWNCTIYFVLCSNSSCWSY